MGSLTLQFRMRPFRAEFDKALIQRFLRHLSFNAIRAMKEGMEGSHSGRLYVLRGGRMHRASAPGEYPAVMSGALRKSIQPIRGPMSAGLGTSMHYSGYLAYGTSKMAKRSMSKEALKQSFAHTRKELKGFAKFRRGAP